MSLIRINEGAKQAFDARQRELRDAARILSENTIRVDNRKCIISGIIFAYEPTLLAAEARKTLDTLDVELGHRQANQLTLDEVISAIAEKLNNTNIAVLTRIQKIAASEVINGSRAYPPLTQFEKFQNIYFIKPISQNDRKRLPDLVTKDDVIAMIRRLSLEGDLSVALEMIKGSVIRSISRVHSNYSNYSYITDIYGVIAKDLASKARLILKGDEINGDDFVLEQDAQDEIAKICEEYKMMRDVDSDSLRSAILVASKFGKLEPYQEITDDRAFNEVGRIGLGILNFSPHTNDVLRYRYRFNSSLDKFLTDRESRIIEHYAIRIMKVVLENGPLVDRLLSEFQEPVRLVRENDSSPMQPCIKLWHGPPPPPLGR